VVFGLIVYVWAALTVWSLLYFHRELEEGWAAFGVIICLLFWWLFFIYWLIRSHKKKDAPTTPVETSLP